jgi:hypothetical protein
MKKVAICVPSGDMVHADFSMALAALAYTSGPSPDGEREAIGIAIVNVKGSLVVNNRNNAIEEAKKLGVDYAFFVDSDIVVHPWALRRLLSLDKDIVGATYVQREEPRMLLGKTVDGTMLAQAVHETAITTAEPMEVGALPTGCLLIKMSVFDNLARPYFQTPAHVTDGEPWIEGEDIFFCRMAREAGHKVYLDWATSFGLSHIGQKSNVIMTSTGEDHAIVH